MTQDILPFLAFIEKLPIVGWIVLLSKFYENGAISAIYLGSVVNLTNLSGFTKDNGRKFPIYQRFYSMQPREFSTAFSKQ